MKIGNNRESRRGTNCKAWAARPRNARSPQCSAMQCCINICHEPGTGDDLPSKVGLKKDSSLKHFIEKVPQQVDGIKKSDAEWTVQSMTLQIDKRPCSHELWGGRP